MATFPIRVAIVDDDRSVCRALARLLTASSFDIVTYSSGREFLKSLKLSKPDCLVVDLHMPELTGFDIQRYLTRANIQIPTIVITAHNEPELRGRCVSAGAVAVLLKPIEGAALVRIIESATHDRIRAAGTHSA